VKLSEKVAIALIGRLVSGVFSFATGILLARTLTTADFGTYQQAILIVAYVTPLVIFGIDQSVTFFIPRLRDDHEIKTFVFQTTAILFLIGVLASIGLFVSSGWVSGLFHNDHLRSVLAIFALYPIFNLPFSIVALVLYSLDKQKIAATLEAVSSCTQFLVIAILVWFDCALSLLFLTLVIIALIKMIVSLFIFHGCLKDRSPWRVDVALLRNQLRFSAPLGLSKILPIITVNLDKMIVSAFYAVKEFAVYSVGAI